MKKIAINIGHSVTDWGAEDGLNPAQGDTRYTRETFDNGLLAGVLIRSLWENVVFDVKLFQQQGPEKLQVHIDRIKQWSPDYVISLHRNCVSSSKATGWSVWYHGKNTGSKSIAYVFAENLRAVPNIWGDTAGDVRSDFEIYPPNPTEGKLGGFGILRAFPDTGILFEGGFISNPKDEVWYDDVTILVFIARAMKLSFEKIM